MEKRYYELGGSNRLFKGTPTGIKWNGFDCPMFDRDTAEQIIEEANGYDGIRYSFKVDAIYCGNNLYRFEGWTFSEVKEDDFNLFGDGDQDISLPMYKAI